MKKVKRYISRVLALTVLIFITGCASHGTNSDADKALIEKLLKLAPRISLDEKDLSTFEIKGTIADKQAQVQFVVSGKQPDQIALSLADSTTETPILAGADNSFMAYDSISAEVLLGQGIPKFVFSLENEGFDEQSVILAWGFLPIEDETQAETNIYETVIDISSFLKCIPSYKVSTKDNIHFILEGKSKRGSRVVAYVTPSREEGPYTRLELYKPDTADDQPYLILDDIRINPQLPEETFSFPDTSLFRSILPTRRISLNDENHKQLSFQLWRAVAARLALTGEDNSESRKEIEEVWGESFDWKKIKKKDEKAVPLLKSIFAGEGTSPII